MKDKKCDKDFNSFKRESNERCFISDKSSHLFRDIFLEVHVIAMSVCPSFDSAIDKVLRFL